MEVNYSIHTNRYATQFAIGRPLSSPLFNQTMEEKNGI